MFWIWRTRSRVTPNFSPTSSRVRCGLHFLDHFAQFFEGDVLDLADAFAGDAEFLADFLQGPLWSAVEAEAGAEDGGLADIEVLDHLLQHASDGFFFELFVG